MIVILDTTWTRYFFDKGFNICVFNYRGYGKSTGYPTFYNIAEDFDTIIEYLKSYKSVESFGVYGYSIGGVAVAHALTLHNTDVKFVIAERTFGKMTDVVNNLVGPYLTLLYKYIYDKYYDSSYSYYKGKCVKILTNSVDDEMINFPSSLLVGVSYIVERVEEQNKHLRHIRIFADEYVYVFYILYSYLKYAIKILL